MAHEVEQCFIRNSGYKKQTLSMKVYMSLEDLQEMMEEFTEMGNTLDDSITVVMVF